MCTVCKRFRAQRATAISSPLPLNRIKESNSFEVIGVDFAGPLYTKDNSYKTYKLLITCAVSRAIHLELVPYFKTETFLMAFRRFMARRGVPSTVYSDNALTFKKASKDL